MRIEGDHTFNAPRETVYTLLRDPDALAQAMPGATTLTRGLSDDRYEAQVNVKVGAINGTYGGTVQVSDQRFPEAQLRAARGGARRGRDLEGRGHCGSGGGGRWHRDPLRRRDPGGRENRPGRATPYSVGRARMISQGLESLEKQLAAQHTEVSKRRTTRTGCESDLQAVLPLARPAP